MGQHQIQLYSDIEFLPMDWLTISEIK
jgi:hypothetical protein